MKYKPLRNKRTLLIKFGLFILILFTACEKDNEYLPISNSSENKLLEILVKSTSNDSIFKPNEIKWGKLRLYSTEKGCFISIPAISGNGNNKGKVMFEIIETAISKKYLIYSLNSSVVKNINNGLNFDTHDLLNYLDKEKNKKSPNVYNRSPDLPGLGHLCNACHSDILNEVVIDGSNGNDWANDPDNPINDPWGQPTLGGTVTVGTGGNNGNNNSADDKIINELTGKAKCIYDNLTESSTDFKNAIKKFDGDFPVSHLKFIMEDLGNTRGETRAPNGAGSSPDYVITIALNNNSNIHGVNYRPNLMTTKTIAHEVIHAEMFRKLLSVLDNGGNIAGVTRQNVLDALDGDFPGMYDYYRRHKNWQHQQMATHYRETIADVLKSFDNNQHSNQFYMDLAWEGLDKQSITAWTTLSQSEKDRIRNVILNYINNNKNESCTE